MLDEPTNDLDLETLELLQEMLADYAGTVLLVSHDRDFLDRVATAVVNAEGDGRWVDYAGGYSDMLAQRGRIGGMPAAPPPPPRVRAGVAHAEKAAAAPQKNVVQGQACAGGVARAHGGACTPRSHASTHMLADPGLYGRDPPGSRGAGEALARAEAELAAAEERWLELEMLREEMEGR